MACIGAIARLKSSTDSQDVWLLGFDNGGVSRSIDAGMSWEDVNGGIGLATSICGGYQTLGQSSPCTVTGNEPMVYGAP